MSSRKEYPSRRRARSRMALDFMSGVRLEQISSLGLVFSAGQACETGASLALGIHLSGPDAASTFLQVQGLVVDCRPVESDVLRGGRYRITLLFHGLTKRQLAILARAAAGASSSSACPPPPTASPSPGGVSFFGFDGFPPVCGLN